MARKSTSRSVGRPREFDKEAALEAAMEAFWQKGYEATSMADLCACTGLHKGSLYQAFGDKHSLFMTALQQYADTEFREVAAVAFRSDSPLENIRAAANRICDDAVQDKGCLIINSIVELAPHDPEVKAALRRSAAQRVRLLTDMVDRAKQRGEISVQTEPEMLARQLMMVLAGGATLVKGLVEPDDMRMAVNTMIDSWV
jgi:TetR/AcrR family transcriptional repressor of nem operon